MGAIALGEPEFWWVDKGRGGKVLDVDISALGVHKGPVGHGAFPFLVRGPQRTNKSHVLCEPAVSVLWGWLFLWYDHPCTGYRETLKGFAMAKWAERRERLSLLCLSLLHAASVSAGAVGLLYREEVREGCPEEPYRPLSMLKALSNRYQTPGGCEVSSRYLGCLKYRLSLLKSCSFTSKAEFKIVQSTRGLVWELEAVSALLKPASPPLQFVYCQVCCEPFHKFCLEESERPQEDQLENWCCRRCKFCHVCGRQHQATKVPQNHWETQQSPPLLPGLLWLQRSSSKHVPGAESPCTGEETSWVAPLQLLSHDLNGGSSKKWKSSEFWIPLQGVCTNAFFPYSCSSCWSVTSAETAITLSAWAQTTQQNPPRKRKFGWGILISLLGNSFVDGNAM